LLGSDVSETAVNRARAGVYTQFEAQRGLGVTQMIRWFSESDEGWRVAEALRRNVRFQVHNILEMPPHPGQFDIVMCRNVLLYLSLEKKRAAFERLSTALAPDGWLMLGAGETVIGQTEKLVADRDWRGLYRHAGNGFEERRASRG
jgi:chemotaxis protein methyltransferase CheR